MADDNTITRFWSKVHKTDTCWLWQRNLNNKGYGCFTVRTEQPGRSHRPTYAHRFSWMLANGPIPDGLNVLHRCDTPACVNPAHLRLGTQKDNMAEAASKGRICRVGRPVAKQKITPDDVRAIRQDTRTHRAIAAHYRISHGFVSAIKKRRLWKSVE